MIKNFLAINKKNAIHVIDPFKVCIDEAIQKAKFLSQYKSPFIILGSTDRENFEQIVPAYSRKIKDAIDIKLLWHFVPVPGEGFSLDESADGIICTRLVNSRSIYMRYQSLYDTLEKNENTTQHTKMIQCLGLTLGNDIKSGNVWNAMPVVKDDFDNNYKEQIKIIDSDIVYLYSRNTLISSEICNEVSLIKKTRLLFASGGIQNKSDIQMLFNAGVDFVVYGTILECSDWRSKLHELYE